MKKIILVILMAVMIKTPCLAQKLEPEGMFSINETVWILHTVGFEGTPMKFYRGSAYMGFKEGKVYWCWQGPTDFRCYYDESFCGYIDSPLVSITDSMDFDFWPDSWYYQTYIMQPFGLGFFMELVHNNDNSDEESFCGIGIMLKIPKQPHCRQGYNSRPIITN